MITARHKNAHLGHPCHPLHVAGLLLVCTLATGAEVPTAVSLIESNLVHLRNKPEREWSDFPETADRTRLSVKFAATKNIDEHCLMLRQQDVKQQWFVAMNGKRLGELALDENDMTIGLAVPAEALKDGENELVIESPAAAKTPADDIRVGGAVFLDADNDGRRTSARDYAERLFAAEPGNLAKLVSRLSDYDEATAAQVAHLLRMSGVSVQDEQLRTALKTASPATQAGFQKYVDAWRENEIAK